MERRVIFLGQKTLGERCFDILLDTPEIEIVGIVSNESTDVWWGTNNILLKSAFLAVDTFIDNASRNEDQLKQLIVDTKANTLISVQHPWILSKECIDLVNGEAYNLHNAKLPKYKGHNACNHAIMNGDSTFTSTIHYLAPEVDAGDIIFEKTFDILPEDTAKSLYIRAVESGVLIFRRLIKGLVENEALPRKPIVGAGTFYPRSSITGLRYIRDMNDLNDVDLRARACYFPPFEPAYFAGKELRTYYVLPDSGDYTCA